MSKTKRTETGALDAAWLKEALKNPAVQISDAESGKKIESEKELEELLAEENKPETAAEKKADDQQEQAEELAKNPPGDKKQEAEQKKALKDAEKAKEKQEADQKRAQQEVARRNKENLNTAQRLISKANQATAPVLQRAGEVVDRVAASRTPGGIGLLIVILIFLLFVVVVVNQAGDTRLKQLWYMLTGRASLQGRVTPNGASSSSSNSSSSSSSSSSNSGSSSSSSSSSSDLPAQIIKSIITGGALSYRTYTGGAGF